MQEDKVTTCTPMEATRLYRIRQTAIEMLEDRGYTVAATNKVASYEDFEAKFVQMEGGSITVPKKDLTLYGEKAVEEGSEEERDKHIMVFFVESTKLHSAHIREYYNHLESHDTGCNRAIIVSPTLPTSQAKDSIRMCERGRKIFEHFLESELLINVSKHELVPKHEPMTAKDKQTLLDNLKIKEGQLPRIQLADPIARHYGLRKGNVVKITRQSQTAGHYVTFRLCQS
eukprot:TRINITY_DN554_c0_g1_i1.p2 TRINITY_DN554_c0_g1~~TRINITY_DN554_c0_g1_i1.p2  ORF type:complete len:229 (+),score=110.40 TRINITY_DN554_c0_g1_i1:80-766(+)